MNKIFKVKRNSLGQSVVCSEIATSRSKGRVIASALALAVASTVAGQAVAQEHFGDTSQEVSSLEQLELDRLAAIHRDAQDPANGQSLFTELAIKSEVAINEITENRDRIKNLEFVAEETDNNLNGLLGWSQQAYETIQDNNESVAALAQNAAASDEQIERNADKIANLELVAQETEANLDNLLEWSQDAYEAITDNSKSIDSHRKHIQDNMDDIFKLGVISETTVDEVAKNRAQIKDNKATIDALTTASNVLIDEIADNTNDIGKLAVISETTVDEVAKNRAQIKDNHGKIAENKQALAQKADKSVVDAMRSFDTYLASLAGTNQGKVNKLETAVADKADQATVDALTTASNVLIDEIAGNREQIVANIGDIDKLAEVVTDNITATEKTAKQTAKNAQDISKNQADIATLMSRTPAAVDLQPINDKIGALDNSLNDKINKLDDKLSAGVAGAVAIAMMPAPAAGSHYITGGTGFYNGEKALAVGLTGASETGTFTYKIGGSVNSSGSGTFGAGAGYRWK